MILTNLVSALASRPDFQTYQQVSNIRFRKKRPVPAGIPARLPSYSIEKDAHEGVNDLFVRKIVKRIYARNLRIP